MEVSLRIPARALLGPAWIIGIARNCITDAARTAGREAQRREAAEVRDDRQPRRDEADPLADAGRAREGGDAGRPGRADPKGPGPDGARPGGSRDSAGGAAGTAVTDLDARRRRPRRGVPYPLAAAAAAAALVVGAASVWGVQRLGVGPEPTVLATAELEPLAGYTAQGSAEVDERPDGTRRLVVRTDPAAVDGFKEVWLLAPDAQRMVSLGVMAGDEAEFVLPENLDVGQFPVVDVSDEPVDGDPTHSGDSIVRGVLDV